MQLPAPIDAYFKSDDSSDSSALTAPFATNAVVVDESAEHSGHAEISAWRLETWAKYPGITSEPVQQVVDGDRVVVTCKVSGDFPNSPVMLDFTFTLANGQISLLEIY